MAVVKRKNSADQMRARLITGGLKGIQTWGQLVAQRAELNAPVDTSHLAKSIHAGVPEMPDLFVFSIDIGTDVPYARAQEMGSGLHSETGPRRRYPIIAGFWTGKSDKKALAFNWPGGPTDSPGHQGGDNYLFAYVMHPGVRAQPYLRPALRETKVEGRLLFLDNIKTEISSI